MRTLTALTLTALLVAATSCSSDDPAETTPEPTTSSSSTATAPAPAPTPEPTTPAPSTTTPAATSPAAPTDDGALRGAVQSYSDAFLTGDADTAYAQLTERCRARTDEAQFASIVEQAADLYGSALAFETYEADVNGDQARVTYTYAVAAINQQQEPWAREAGVWHNDDC